MTRRRTTSAAAVVRLTTVSSPEYALVEAPATAVGVPAGAPVARRVDYNWDVRPLLSDYCFRCHGPDSNKRKAKLRLDRRDGVMKDIGEGWAVVKPGNPDRSELVRRIFADLEDDMMPPPDSHLALSDQEKALLRRWVAEGADYRQHWSLEPVRAAAVPGSGHGAAVRTRSSSVRPVCQIRLGAHSARFHTTWL